MQKFRSRLSLFLALILVLTLVSPMLPKASAATVVASGTCGDDVTWSLDDAGVLTLSGTGATADYSDSSDEKRPPFYSYKSQINSIVIEEGITYIGNFLFSECAATSVVIPEGVTIIGYYAFAYCPNLSSVSFPDSLTNIKFWAFYHCTSLTGLSFPDGMDKIESRCFDGCTSLTTVTFEGYLRSLAPLVFAGCSNLTSVRFNGQLKIMGYNAFQQCVNLKTIKFTGNAPDFEENVFVGIADGTVYYPANNDTWTEDIRQNYAGTVTWVAVLDGDTDNSGSVNVIDILRLKQMLLKDTWTEDDLIRCDLNGNGTIDATDMASIRQIILAE